jgi:hypothetical protein
MASRILPIGLYNGATVLSETTLSGFPASNMLNGKTNYQAGFEVGADRSVVFDMGESINLTGVSLAVGIAKHNLFTVTASIVLAGSADNVSYTTISTLTPASDGVQYWPVTISASYRYIRITVTGHGGNAYIANFSFGTPVVFPSGQPSGFVDPTQGFRDDVRSNVTRGNELAGLTIISRPKEFKISANKVPFADFDTFADQLFSAVSAGPFYFKWANTTEDGIDAAPAFAWLKDKMPASRWDGILSKSLNFDCMGFS